MEHTSVFQNKRIAFACLFFIVLSQLLLYCHIFVSQKSAHHEDEFLSYGLSNSTGRPFLYGSDYSVYDNYDTWMSGDDFRNYISVQPGRGFDYSNVWENQALDTHPPLYYAILHSISSLFPGTFSWWWAFFINLLAFVITQLLLFMLTHSISSRYTTALMTCLLWGFCMGGQNTQLFLRMYSLQTMFCVLFVYLMHCSLCSAAALSRSRLLLIMLTTLGGALSQHLFLVFAFFYTLAGCIYLLACRKWRYMLCIGLAVLIGAMLSFVIFPASFVHFFGDRQVIWHGEATLSENLHFLLILIVGELSGILFHLHSARKKWEVFYMILAFLIPSILIIAISSDNALRRFLKRASAFLGRLAKSSGYSALSLLFIAISSFQYLMLISGRIYYGEFGMESDRYILPLLPLLACLIISCADALLRALCQRIAKKRHPGSLFLGALICVLLLFQNLNPIFRNYVQHSNPENGSVHDYLAGQNCLLLISPIYLPCFCELLSDASDIYIALPYEQEYLNSVNEGVISRLSANGSFYLLFDTEYKEGDELMALLQYLSATSGCDVYYLSSESTHSVRLSLYEFRRPGQ